jgi:hypothetical protein
VLASTISAFATLTLLTKNSFLDEIKKQYVMTAKAKGLKENRVLYGHVFRNAMLIVIAGFPAVFVGVFFGGLADHRDDLLARRAGAAGVRGGGGAGLPGDLRHALRLRPDRAGGEHPVGPDVCVDRPAHRLRNAGDLRRWRCADDSPRPRAPRSIPRRACGRRRPIVRRRRGPGWLSPLNKRRWENFKANRRAYWSLWIFLCSTG